MDESSRCGESQRRPWRVVFCGTPEFAVPALRALAIDPRFSIELVVTQPDRSAGRGRKMTQPLVKRAAVELDLPVYQPDTLRTRESRLPIQRLSADILVVAAFGLIFGRHMLGLPLYGCVNAHASLLPRYRGASPVAAAILSGDSRTGISLMVMDAAIDTGPIIGSRALTIAPSDTTETLTERLGLLAASVLIETLPDYLRGNLVPLHQDQAGASYTRPLTKSDGWINWEASASEIERFVRAMWSWPRSWTTAGDRALQVHRARIAGDARGELPGTILRDRNRLLVSTGDGLLELVIVQSAGGKPVSGADWLAGVRGTVSRLGISGAPLVQAPPISVVES